jgi:hypothetical protein
MRASDEVIIESGHCKKCGMYNFVSSVNNLCLKCRMESKSYGETDNENYHGNWMEDIN